MFEGPENTQVNQLSLTPDEEETIALKGLRNTDNTSMTTKYAWWLHLYFFPMKHIKQPERLQVNSSETQAK